MRRGACVVLNDADGRILLTLREDFEVWCLPGGEVEDGESHREAACREALEEVGVHIAIAHEIGRYVRGGDLGEMTSVAFAAHIVGGDPRPDGVESLEIGWFDPNDLPTMLWWNKPPIADFVAGRRDVDRRLAVTCRHGSVTRADLYALRDRSELSRREFYEAAFPEPDLASLVGDH